MTPSFLCPPLGRPARFALAGLYLALATTLAGTATLIATAAGARAAPAATAQPPSAERGARSASDQADILRAEKYLDGIRSLTADFIQIAPDGSISNGKLYLRRPGRVRFEYNPPSPTLVVADGTWIVFHDRELKQTTRLPLLDSPLSILLADKVELTDSVSVKSVVRSPGALRITVFDPTKPKQGTLTLVFADQPLSLRQWEVTDAEGQKTIVALDHMDTNVTLPQRLFVFYDSSARENRLGE